MQKKAIKRFSISLLLLFLIALFFFFNFTTVIVDGHSMDPTFRTGQRLLACKAYWLIGGIQDKDIVVIRSGKSYIIKRVYRSGGEIVDFANVPEDWRIEAGEYKVPDGFIYVIGDNRPISEDSRKFGPVPISQVIGKIVRL